MKRWLPFPLLWVLLVLMWLALNETLAPAHLILGAFIAALLMSGLVTVVSSRTTIREDTGIGLLFTKRGGENLSDTIGRGPLPVARAVSIARSGSFMPLPRVACPRRRRTRAFSVARSAPESPAAQHPL